MSNYLKLCATHSDYETFIASQDFITPNVSYCEDQNEVHYNPYVLTYEYGYAVVNSTSEYASTPAPLCIKDSLGQIYFLVNNEDKIICAQNLSSFPISYPYTESGAGIPTFKYSKSLVSGIPSSIKYKGIDDVSQSTFIKTELYRNTGILIDNG